MCDQLFRVKSEKEISDFVLMPSEFFFSDALQSRKTSITLFSALARLLFWFLFFLKIFSNKND